MQTVLPIRGGLCSHAGHNPGNQDSVLGLAWNDHPSGLRMVAAVADGVGGQRGGDRASRAVVQGIRDFIETLPPRSTRGGLERLLVAAIDAGFERLALEAAGEVGMSTTLVLAMAAGEEMVVGWLGDSRAYLVEPDGVRCLTQDHSVLSEDLALGRATVEDLRTGRVVSSPGLTRCMNAMERCAPDLSGEGGRPFLSVRGDSALVLTSDGVTGNAVVPFVEPPEIERLVRGSSSPRRAAEFLVGRAIEKGSGDNVSAVVVEFGTMTRRELPPSDLPPSPDEALERRREPPVVATPRPVAPRRPVPVAAPAPRRSAILVAGLLFLLSLSAAVFLWLREHHPEFIPAQIRPGTALSDHGLESRAEGDFVSVPRD